MQWKRVCVRKKWSSCSSRQSNAITCTSNSHRPEAVRSWVSAWTVKHAISAGPILDYVKVRCIADIDLAMLEGKGHLEKVEAQAGD